jgi:outer membrane protein OmpA-like peptidoglycan-associated protein
MINKALIAAIAIAMGCGTAQAGTTSTKAQGEFIKEAGKGMLTGAAAGAAIGGPVGAAVGFMVGAVMGDSFGTAKHAAKQAEMRAQVAEAHSQSLEKDLLDTRLALAKASERTGGDEMLDALAERLHADVLFRTAAADLDAPVATQLQELGKLLSSHSQLEIELHGFADPRGNPEKNIELSLLRANAVREALIEGGAAPEQIQVKAYGEDLSTAPKGDLEAYAWERRVSVAIRPTGQVAVAQTR